VTLVGDAGCHKDPILALGMCDALRDAEFLADAVDEGFLAAARQFFLARQGMIPRETFFNPATLQQLLGQARAQEPSRGGDVRRRPVMPRVGHAGRRC
jgi:flavin-dependent dehydrogenase